MLAKPVSFGPGSPVNLVVYAEPAGAVLATDYKSLVNSNCLGEETLAICASRPSVFVTVSDEKPTVDRYVLDVQGDSNGVPWADMLLTMLFDHEKAPVGATVQQIYTGQKQARSMNSLQFTFASISANDGAFDLNFYGASAPWLDDFKRAGGGTHTISSLVEATVTVTTRKL